jgi:spermidine synthase
MRLIKDVDVFEHSNSTGWIVAVNTTIISGEVYIVETQRGGCRVFKDLETVVTTLRREKLTSFVVHLEKPSLEKN